MILSNWFAMHPDAWTEKDLVLSVTTDTIGKNACLLSVTASRTHGRQVAPETLFVAGGNVNGNREITEIDPKEYEEKALGRSACEENLKKLLTGVKMIVSYSVSYYTGKVLAQTFPTVFNNYPILDVVNLARVQSAGLLQEALSNATDASSLIYWIENKAMNVSGNGKLQDNLALYSLENVGAGLPAYKKRNSQVAALFNTLMVVQ